MNMAGSRAEMGVTVVCVLGGGHLSNQHQQEKYSGHAAKQYRQDAEDKQAG